MTALLSDFVALGVTVLIVAAFLSFIRNLRNVHGVAPALTRKLAHAGTGILFLICWGLFSANAESKYVAGIVPAFTTARFVMVGVGLLNDPAVRSLGARDQLVRGPLAYGVVFTALTIFYWRHVVALLVAVALCLGDGAVTALALSNAAPKQPNLRRAVSALIFFVVCVGAALPLNRARSPHGLVCAAWRAADRRSLFIALCGSHGCVGRVASAASIARQCGACRRHSVCSALSAMVAWTATIAVYSRAFHNSFFNVISLATLPITISGTPSVTRNSPTCAHENFRNNNNINAAHKQLSSSIYLTT
jgi:hypothetical protein